MIAMTDPPMLSIVVAMIARLRGARLINWLQDLFPEVAEALHVGGRLGPTCISGAPLASQRVLRRAALNVAIGELMAKRLSQFEIEPQRIAVIPNWADCDAIAPVESHANTLQLIGTYRRLCRRLSGNLGRAHDIENFAPGHQRNRCCQRSGFAGATDPVALHRRRQVIRGPKARGWNRNLEAIRIPAVSAARRACHKASRLRMSTSCPCGPNSKGLSSAANFMASPQQAGPRCSLALKTAK